VHIERRDEAGNKLPPIRRVSPVQTRRGAERFERELRAELDAGVYGKEVEEKTIPTLAEFEDEFIENYAKVHNKHSEVISKKGIFRNHVVPELGEKRLDEIRRRDIDRFKAAQLGKGLVPKTVNNHLALLSKLLNTAVEWEILDHAPRVKLLKVEESEFDFLDFGELSRLEHEANDADDPMVTVFSKTGLRVGEYRAVTWDDVDLVAKRLIVRRNIVHGKIGSPKSGKSREIPLCDSVVRAFKSLRSLRDGYVFCGDDGEPLSLTVLYGRLRFYCKKAGLRRIGFHVLRHTFASHLVMKGVPLKVVQELLGHSTIEMTMRYAHLSPGVKREYVSLLDQDFGENLRANRHKHSTSEHDAVQALETTGQ
jgi:integrase